MNTIINSCVHKSKSIYGFFTNNFDWAKFLMFITHYNYKNILNVLVIYLAYQYNILSYVNIPSVGSYNENQHKNRTVTCKSHPMDDYIEDHVDTHKVAIYSSYDVIVTSYELCMCYIIILPNKISNCIVNSTWHVYVHTAACPRAQLC